MPSRLLNVCLPIVFTTCLIAALSACSVDDPSGPHIRTLAPTLVAQEGQLIIYGSGFGAWNEATNTVTINGSCADVLLWQDDVIVVVVPGGVGNGGRILTLTNALGQQLQAPVDITGPDRPERVRRCQTRFGPPDDFEIIDPDMDMMTPDVPEVVDPKRYPFVMISNEAGQGGDGADLDALRLVKGNGQEFFATEVVLYEPGLGEPTDPGAILFAPDSVQPNDFQTCFDTPTASLGAGDTGRIIVGFGDGVLIEEGDTLAIYEVGICFVNGEQAAAERFVVSLSEDGTGDSATTVTLGSGFGPELVFRNITLP